MKPDYITRVVKHNITFGIKLGTLPSDSLKKKISANN